MIRFRLRTARFLLRPPSFLFGLPVSYERHSVVVHNDDEMIRWGGGGRDQWFVVGASWEVKGREGLLIEQDMRWHCNKTEFMEALPVDKSSYPDTTILPKGMCY